MGPRGGQASRAGNGGCKPALSHQSQGGRPDRGRGDTQADRQDEEGRGEDTRGGGEAGRTWLM